MLVNGALCDFVDDPHSHRLRFTSSGLVGDVLPGRSHVDILPKPRMADIFAASLQFIQPSLLGFLARIPLDNEPGTVLYQDSQTQQFDKLGTQSTWRHPSTNPIEQSSIR